MKNYLKAMFLFVAVALTASCGSHNDNWYLLGQSASGPTGKVTQGSVAGATVYADSLVSGKRFVIDSGEASAVTDAAGNFKLSFTPTYNHVIVSVGGTDILTHTPALQMIAPAGSNNVTPLTTLVALDSTGTVQAKILALLPPGVNFDVDLTSGNVSQAAVLLAQSVQTTVQSLTTALNNGNKITATQLAAIQTQIIQNISTEIASLAVTPTTLSTPTNLASTMQTAAAAAITAISTDNANINLNATAASVAASAVATAVNSTATALNVGATASTAPVPGGESSLVTQTAVNNIASAVTTAATAIVTDPSYTPPTATPAGYSQPPTPVINAPFATAFFPVNSAVVAASAVGSVTVTFSDNMLNNAADPASAANPANWVITANGITVPVTSVTYNSGLKSFSAVPASTLPNGATIIVKVMQGVANTGLVGTSNVITWSFMTQATGSSGGAL